MTTLEVVAGELYGLPPADFVAARTAHVRQAKGAKDAELARDVGALRKPSTAAWVVNLLVRRRRDDVEQLLRLGEALREAQSSLSGAELRDLNRTRHQVLTALGRQARALAADAGQRVSAGVAEEVQATLGAALADPDAADQVRAGRLTTALSYEGFGPAAPSGATPRPAERPQRAAAARGGAAGTAERADEDEDAESVRAAVAAEAERARAERVERARQEAERREQQRRERERRARLEKERRQAAAAVRAAEAEADQARARADAADRALAKARTALERADRLLRND